MKTQIPTEPKAQAAQIIAAVQDEIEVQEQKRGKFVVKGTADLNQDVPKLLRMHGKMYVKFDK